MYLTYLLTYLLTLSVVNKPNQPRTIIRKTSHFIYKNASIYGRYAGRATDTTVSLMMMMMMMMMMMVVGLVRGWVMERDMYIDTLAKVDT